VVSSDIANKGFCNVRIYSTEARTSEMPAAPMTLVIVGLFIKAGRRRHLDLCGGSQGPPRVKWLGQCQGGVGDNGAVFNGYITAGVLSVLHSPVRPS